MFTFTQFKLADNFSDTEEFKRMKIRFHFALFKKEEDVWSLVKYVKLISITTDSMFKGVLQNNRYIDVREYSVLFDFTSDEFPLMNLNDLITIMKIMGNLGNNEVKYKTLYIIGYIHINGFLDCYLAHLALTDYEFTTAFNKNSKVPKSLLKLKINVDDYIDGEIINEPLGVVFHGKNVKGGKKKFFFRTDDVERDSN